MNLLIIFVLAGGALASPSKEAVALDCGEFLTLNDEEMMDVEFESERGITGDCEFTIKGPKNYHVEVACTGGSATVDGKNATNYHGPLPAIIKFNLESQDEPIYCRVGLTEEHEDLSSVHGRDGTATSIQEFEAAFNIKVKNETYAAAVLAANEKLIDEINADRANTWVARVTNMADKTEDEIKNVWTGRVLPPSQEEQDRRTAWAERELLTPLRSLKQNLPESVDLTTMGRVSPAKRQGACGTCSVFASVSTIESCFHKATGTLPTDLSEQHMMDCAYGVGGSGCQGGSADRYHEWMYRNHNGGLANEAEYPYRAATTGTDQCQNQSNANYGAKVTGYQKSWSASEEDIMALLAAGHSVTTGMQVEGDFALLGYGIYQSIKCKNCRNEDGSITRSEQNHDITIVGYGVENGVKYWKLKNSWGSGWAENGFSKFLRGKGHCCLGIDFSVPLCTATGTGPATTAAPTTAAPASTTAAPVATCGGKLMARKGSIISEGYPTAYKDNQDCTWTIHKRGSKIIKFTVESLDIEEHGKCNYDYIQFNNSADSPISLGSEEGHSAGKLCGSSIPAPIFSSGNSAIIKFHTDHSVQAKGFKINYEFLSCKNQQLRMAVGVEMVSFSTLRYPSNYANNLNCDWTITVPEGQTILLKFEAFETEYGYDKVTVYDGSSTSSTSMGVYQGNTIPSIISSTGNKMLITFTSDYSKTRKGFKAKATAALAGTCGGKLTAQKDSIISEGYQTAYKDNQDCTWTIQKPGNKIVKLTVESLDIEEHRKCSFDYLQFNNSADSIISLGSEEAPGNGKLCGSSIPAPIFSSGNSAIIKFHTDNDVQGKGFKINYEFVTQINCKNQHLRTAVGLEMVLFSTLGYPSNYANNQSCDWTITVPEGQTIMLKFDAFETEYGNDKVTVYDGSSTLSTVLGTYYGNTIPSIISSTGNKMLVTFISDYSKTREGFKAKAVAAQAH